MDEKRVAKTLEVARQISAELASTNLRCMVIGAAAMAVHGYARQSVDLDLAMYANPFETLGFVRDHLAQKGYHVDLILPDGEDPLGGVINVTGSDFDLVQIINFQNPLNPQKMHKFVGEILRHVEPGSSGLAIAPLEVLIALKLYAGDMQSLNDIGKLLEANPDLDRNQVNKTCEGIGLKVPWEKFNF